MRVTQHKQQQLGACNTAQTAALGCLWHSTDNTTSPWHTVQTCITALCLKILRSGHFTMAADRRVCSRHHLVFTLPCHATGWSGMSVLKSLTLAYNPLSGPIPSDSLPNGIHTVNIQGTGLSGSLPSSWNSLNMQCLNLYDSPALCGPYASTLPCMLLVGTSIGEVLQWL